LASALFGSHWQGAVLNTTLSGKIVRENVLFILLNFPTPNILLAGVGLWAIGRKDILAGATRRFGKLVLVLAGIYLAFAFRYTVPDRYSFFIPFYGLTALLIGLGASEVLRENKHQVIGVFLLGICLPVAVYGMAPAAARRFYPALGGHREVPYRDNYRYFLQPWRTGYDGAERFAREALATARSGDIIRADNTTVYPLLYAQEVHGEGQGVFVVSVLASTPGAPELSAENIETLRAERRIFVVTPQQGYCPDWLLERYRFRKVGILWEVIPREKANAAGGSGAHPATEDSQAT